jgi:hypothetical protein
MAIPGHVQSRPTLELDACLLPETATFLGARESCRVPVLHFSQHGGVAAKGSLNLSPQNGRQEAILSSSPGGSNATYPPSSIYGRFQSPGGHVGRDRRPGEGHPVAENLLARQFDVTSPTPTWVSDITYIATREGWLYLAVVLSIQTRQVLGCSLSDRMPVHVPVGTLRDWEQARATAPDSRSWPADRPCPAFPGVTRPRYFRFSDMTYRLFEPGEHAALPGRTFPGGASLRYHGELSNKNKSMDMAAQRRQCDSSAPPHRMPGLTLLTKKFFERPHSALRNIAHAS